MYNTMNQHSTVPQYGSLPEYKPPDTNKWPPQSSFSVQEYQNPGLYRNELQTLDFSPFDGQDKVRCETTIKWVAQSPLVPSIGQRSESTQTSCISATCKSTCTAVKGSPTSPQQQSCSLADLSKSSTVESWSQSRETPVQNDGNYEPQSVPEETMLPLNLLIEPDKITPPIDENVM